jgi:hypothetical protein
MLRRLCERYSEWSSHEEQPAFFSWRRCGSSTQAWMPAYVSILRIPQMIRVWRATVEWYIDRGIPKNSEKILSQCNFCPTQIPHGLTRMRNRASAVGGQWLTTWAMARPSNLPYFSLKSFLCPLKQLLYQYKCWHNLPKKHLMKWCRPSQPSSSLFHSYFV